MKSTLNTLWMDWCWKWNSNTWPPDTNSWLTGKDPDAGKNWRQKEKGKTGWDSWMASLTQWTRSWANSGRRWGTGKPGVLQSMGMQGWTCLTDWRTTCTPWWGFPGGSVEKNPPANAGDVGLTPGMGGSPGDGNGNPLPWIAWEIPWTEEPGGLHSIGFQKRQTLLSE